LKLAQERLGFVGWNPDLTETLTTGEQRLGNQIQGCTPLMPRAKQHQQQPWLDNSQPLCLSNLFTATVPDNQDPTKAQAID
jgi:hypothetical protein